MHCLREALNMWHLGVSMWTSGSALLCGTVFTNEQIGIFDVKYVIEPEDVLYTVV